jgi:hypothetical protein
MSWHKPDPPQNLLQSLVTLRTTIEMMGFRLCELTLSMSEGSQARDRNMSVVVRHSAIFLGVLEDYPERTRLGTSQTDTRLEFSQRTTPHVVPPGCTQDF